MNKHLLQLFLILLATAASLWVWWVTFAPALTYCSAGYTPLDTPAMKFIKTIAPVIALMIIIASLIYYSMPITPRRWRWKE